MQRLATVELTATVECTVTALLAREPRYVPKDNSVKVAPEPTPKPKRQKRICCCMDATCRQGPFVTVEEE